MDDHGTHSWMKGLLRRNSIYLTKWVESIFASSLAKLVFRLGPTEERGDDPEIKRKRWGMTW